jgi:hypothetical protein
MHHIMCLTGILQMIPLGNIIKIYGKLLIPKAVSDLSKWFKYSKNIPNLNLRGESCD